MLINIDLFTVWSFGGRKNGFIFATCYKVESRLKSMFIKILNDWQRKINFNLFSENKPFWDDRYNFFSC